MSGPRVQTVCTCTKVPVYRPCHVVNEGCTAAPGLADSRTEATCYACGEAVCVNLQCSGRRKWYGKRVRVCDHCWDEENRRG